MARCWYILHTYSGFEEKVKIVLLERIKKAGQEDLFGEILVPTEQVVEMIKGAKKTSARKFFPGYILINVDLNDETWHTVRDTPKVTGFVGNDLNPEPLPDEDAMKIIGRIQDGAAKPKPKVMYEEGDEVRVIDGPFSNFQGVVDTVYPDKGRVRVMVSIFGRQTPVELEFVQVTKG
ncbi:MAG: transcription termination/antitermination protein NusG [Desulfobulbaceae bacterium]|jgi:transcriptional antiterminator NusG|nr:transcription termination/antitermination protein NusG [Deltaproteobacteria bacterium]MCK5194422.1 transcription termination/antitermination protein NusG [Desulfobulbaceae bacterium]NOR10971.1 transcription termination/antitermination protein NusG [Desulfovibrionaceae bacterium]